MKGGSRGLVRMVVVREEPGRGVTGRGTQQTAGDRDATRSSSTACFLRIFPGGA